MQTSTSTRSVVTDPVQKQKIRVTLSGLVEMLLEKKPEDPVSST